MDVSGPMARRKLFNRYMMDQFKVPTLIPLHAIRTGNSLRSTGPRYKRWFVVQLHPTGQQDDIH